MYDMQRRCFMRVNKMSTLSIDEYNKEKTDCEGLCDITDEVMVENNYMRCVTCPFCKETVDAILTKTTIACPACDVIVDR